MAAISLTPHIAKHDRRGKVIAAQFRQIVPGDDAELGRECLEQHGDQIGEHGRPKAARSRICAPAWMLVAKLPGST